MGAAASPAPVVSEPIVSEVPDDAVIVDAPASPVEQTSTDAGLERAALIVFLLDRSVDDPFAADPNNPCVRLLGQANDWLSKMAKKPTGQMDVAVVSYGVDSTGETEIRNSFEAGLTGRTIVADSELEAGTIRILETEQQLPNGIGGLMTVPIKQHILVELEPTGASSPGAAFEAVAELLGDWCGRHPQAAVPPVVLHLTRCEHSASDLVSAAATLQACSVASGPTVLYHSIATETPHTSLSYCESESELDGPELQGAFAASSALLGRDQLSESKPALVKPQSRGIVVNGKFDLLLDGIRAALS